MLVEKAPAILEWAKQTGKAVAPLVAAAAAGALIGCALGKIEEFERKIVTPFIAEQTANALSFLGLTDDIGAAKLKISL